MSPISGPAVWRPEDVNNDDSWRFELDDQTRAEIRRNIAEIAPESIKLKDITAENFPLPSFVQRRNAMNKQLGSGRGIAKLSGLDVENYTLEELKIIYCGLVAHFGITVSKPSRRLYRRSDGFS